VSIHERLAAMLEAAAQRQRARARRRGPNGGERPALAARPHCGARCRSGSPCEAPRVWVKGADAPRSRCRMHGGLSTGPRTPEGRATIAQSNRRRAAQRRAAQAQGASCNAAR
jgi:hypothetical protein